VLGGNINDIVNTRAGNGDVRDVQRLAYNEPIHIV
jgi:hypothetical protein